MNDLLLHATQRPVPGLRFSSYPERADTHSVRAPIRATAPGARELALRLRRVRAHQLAWQPLSDDLLLRGLAGVRDRLMTHGLQPAVLDETCAYVVSTAERLLGVAAYDPQILAALAILDNRLVEMATGEGKSLAAAIAASVAALAGLPVHVLTANDYLVRRDAQTFGPLFSRLGLDTAAITADAAPAARRIAYGRAIVYITASELVFDYLRDRAFHGAGRAALQRRARQMADPAAEPPLLHGLSMVIIDEADSILIDEARVPLILSGPVDGSRQRAWAWQAWALSAPMREGKDFVRRSMPREEIELTEAGLQHLDGLTPCLRDVWRNRRHRDEAIVTALTARHLLQRDRDYLVTDKPAAGDAASRPGHRPHRELRIIDPVAGRVAVGRKWSRGLQAMVCLKEGCDVEPELETLAQITYQRFFRRCIRVGGMSGTLSEVRRESARLYGLDTVTVAPRCAIRHVAGSSRWFVDDEARWQAVVPRVAELVRQGRPVLIGTESVAASFQLSEKLRAAGIGHAVLNARSDADEADLVAAAGCAGRVTVSTHMAGRGTHIALDAQALRCGGLHVLNCQRNASRRHDRQLAGRCARQGQPGSSEIWLSLQAARFGADGLGRLVAMLARARVVAGEVRWPGGVLAAAHTLMQRVDEGRAERRRQRMFKLDAQRDRGLSFCDI